jgi:D-beta-D-heptose 7-phosphate kinase/D-beta-D-heptose 1-phosphate adenosyltransferase
MRPSALLDLSCTIAISWELAGRKLIDDLGLDACLVTLDRDGMFLAARDGSAHFIRTLPREFYDVTGAGDVVGGLWPLPDCWRGDGVGGKVGQRCGRTGSRQTWRGRDIACRIGASASTRPSWLPRDKILALREVLPILERCRAEGLRIAFTNGCFDLLHVGHVDSLEFARSQGDLLVVGLNDDASVCQIKGVGVRSIQLPIGPGSSPPWKRSITWLYSTNRAPKTLSERSAPTSW